jgi:hypothetical protein
MGASRRRRLARIRSAILAGASGRDREAAEGAHCPPLQCRAQIHAQFVVCRIRYDRFQASLAASSVDGYWSGASRFADAREPTPAPFRNIAEGSALEATEELRQMSASGRKERFERL